MQFNQSIPNDLARPQEEAPDDDLGQAALERLALDGYQAGKLNTFQVQKLLGLTNRYDTQSWLGQMGAHEHYTLTDLAADRQAHDRLLPS